MVRTSLDPVLQVAAEKSLRDGLMAYDRKLGGWRGAVAHLTLPADDFETKWPAALNEQPRPPGMLPNGNYQTTKATLGELVKADDVIRVKESIF